MNKSLPNIFIAPRSGEHSTKNFNKTMEGGYKKSELINYLSEADKKNLESSDVLMVWGNKPSLKSRGEKMKRNDWVLFYQHGTITYAGKLLYKTHNKTLADELWGQQRDDKGKPVSWEYVFFLTELKPVKKPYRIMADLAGYKGAVVQGFLPYSKRGTERIIAQYGSIEEFLNGDPEMNKGTPIAESTVSPQMRVVSEQSIQQNAKSNQLIHIQKQKHMDKLNFRAEDKELRDVLYGRERYKIPKTILVDD